MVLAPQHECSARQRLQLLLAAGTLQISLVLCEQTFCDPEINRSYAMMAGHYGVGIVTARTSQLEVTPSQVRLRRTLASAPDEDGSCAQSTITRSPRWEAWCFCLGVLCCPARHGCHIPWINRATAQPAPRWTAAEPHPTIARATTRSPVSQFMNKFRKLRFIDYNGHLQFHSSLLSVVLRD